MPTENKLISIDGHKKKAEDNQYRQQCEKMFYWFGEEKEKILNTNCDLITSGALTPREAHDVAQILMNLRQAENWFYGEALDETGKLPSGKKNTERR